MSRGIERVAQAQRRLRVAQAMGEGYRASRPIANRLHEKHGIEVHHSTVAKDIQALELDYQEFARDTVDKERGITLSRLERYVQILNDKLDNAVITDDEGRKYDQTLPAIRLLKELEETRARMLGLNMPSKIAHTDPSGKKEYTGIPDDFKRRYFSQDLLEVEEIEDADVVE